MLRTERLLLRPPRPGDEGMELHLEQWRALGIGKFVAERLDDGVVVGRVGVQFLDPLTWEPAQDEHGQPELGWTLGAEHRGRGYATEAALAVRRWYGASCLVSLIAPDNVPSQRVAERLGARPERTVVLADATTAVVWVHP